MPRVSPAMKGLPTKPLSFSLNWESQTSEEVSFTNVTGMVHICAIAWQVADLHIQFSTPKFTLQALDRVSKPHLVTTVLGLQPPVTTGRPMATASTSMKPPTILSNTSLTRATITIIA